MLFRASSSALLPRAQRCVVSAPCHRAALRPGTAVRMLASKDDKSWGDILGDAANLAKEVVNKVTTSVSQALTPTKEEDAKPAPRQQPRQPSAPLDRQGPGLVGSLLGRAVGGLVATAIDRLGKQLEQAAAENQSVYEDAAARIMASSKLRAAMGEVRVGPIISQSSSSMYINGVSQKSVNLLFQVFGSAGQVAQAQVVSQGTDKSRSSAVTVQLPNGQLVRIEEGGGRGFGASGAGQTIDVEFKEVNK